jgi:hypothetical protein
MYDRNLLLDLGVEFIHLNDVLSDFIHSFPNRSLELNNNNNHVFWSKA